MSVTQHTPTTPHQAQKIHRLPPRVAEQIAAGEVIERPASVVKELIENSLDAGAKQICVRVEAGGRNRIEVTDDGGGMNALDLALCVERHATSKIREFSDLDSLATLGFRGEALAAVDAVAQITITTRQTSSDLDPGTAWEWREQKISKTTFGHFLHEDHGTRIEVRALFSQVPARLKFLRAPGAEVSHIRDWIERLALSHPEVSFEFWSEERALLRLKAGTLENRLREILNSGASTDGFPLQSIVLDQSLPSGVRKVQLYWLQGYSSPQARRLVQVVNSRCLKDKMIQQALMAPFRQALLPGQFPAVALFLELDPSLVDMNAHPTKSEVRFSEPREVFHAIESAAQSLISRHGAVGFPKREFSPKYSVQSFAAAPFDSAEGAPHKKEGSVNNSFSLSSQRPSFEQHALDLPNRAMNTWGAAEPTQPKWAKPLETKDAFGSSFESRDPSAQKEIGADSAKQTEATPREAFNRNQFRGIIFSTYLIYDLGTEMGLIDQHAAHERVQFESLKKGLPTSSQDLLLPEVIHLDTENRVIIESWLPMLIEQGFGVEFFGDSAVVFRAIPTIWGTHSLKMRLKSLVDRLQTLAPHSPPNPDSAQTHSPNQLIVDARLFEVLASQACKSSVRAHDSIDASEALELVDRLFDCEHPWSCPHGRPTVVKIPSGRFEEWFMRRAPQTQAYSEISH